VAPHHGPDRGDGLPAAALDIVQRDAVDAHADSLNAASPL
jgi:hypothetical protein